MASGSAMAAPVSGAPLPAPAICKPAPNPTAALLDETIPPAGTRGYDVLSYDLDLRLDPSARTIVGQVIIGLAGVDAFADLSLVQLDLVPELTVTGVFDAQGALAHNHTDSRLEISLRQPLGRGATDSLTVTWQGRPPRHGIFLTGLMFRSHDPGTPQDPSDDTPIVASLSQTWSAHSWWPCKDHPADKALVSLAVTVPDTLAAVSNGALLAVTTPEPGWRRFAWRERYPLPTYLVSVAASNYVSWSEDCLPSIGPSVRLDYHVFPQDQAEAQHDLALTCDMMVFLTDLFGPWPYPGEKYAQVEFKWIGGMEHTTATSLAQLVFTGDRRWENLFLHELVHQWFGDSLTPSVWADIWLNEGFARYGEALWVERRLGRQAYLEFMGVEIGPIRHPELFRGDGMLSDPVPILPNTLVYDKGAWVLHMLREMIGDDAFFTFLHDYAQDPRLVHGSVTTADMIARAEAAAGRPLDGFFGPWLETDLVPVISHEVTWRWPDRVALTLRQHQDPSFEVPVPVVIHGACGDQHLTLPLTGLHQTFIVDVSCAVDSVSIAPDGLALLRDLGSAPPPLLVTGPTPNPVSGVGADFQIFLINDAEVVVNIYDIKGSLVYEEDLSRLTANSTAEMPPLPGHAWHWAGDARGGRTLASGGYFVEFRGNGGRQVRRLTLIK